MNSVTALLLLLVANACLVSEASNGGSVHSRRLQSPVVKQEVVDHWASEDRRHKATTRDLFINKEGQGFIKQKLHQKDDGDHGLFRLKPKGLNKKVNGRQSQKENTGKRKARALDQTETISLVTPEDGSTATNSIVTFEADFGTSTSSLVDIFLIIEGPEGRAIDAFVDSSMLDDGTLTEVLGGFDSAGEWTWYITATHADTLETIESPHFVFSKEEASQPLPGESSIPEASYPSGGQIMEAVGHIYFEVPYENDEGDLEWDGYVCSGTAIRDNKSSRSLILTAAHCIFDEEAGVFARNVLFIPNQDSTTGEGADLDCDNDPCGCWAPSGGVIHEEYTSLEWPLNEYYDYGFYVVEDTGAHSGPQCSNSQALDIAVDEMTVDVSGSNVGEYLTGVGYTEDYLPDLRYCADIASLEDGSLFLPNCQLSGGSSGGPFVRNLDKTSGIGQIVSVNSWSFVDEPGIGGPIMESSPTRCLANLARNVDLDLLDAAADGEAGMKASCYDRPCVPADGSERKLRGNHLGARRLCGGKK